MFPGSGWGEFLSALEERVPFGLGRPLSAVVVIVCAFGIIAFAGRLVVDNMILPLLSALHITGELPDTRSGFYVALTLATAPIVVAAIMLVRVVTVARRITNKEMQLVADTEELAHRAAAVHYKVLAAERLQERIEGNYAEVEMSMRTLVDEVKRLTQRMESLDQKE